MAKATATSRNGKTGTARKSGGKSKAAAQSPAVRFNTALDLTTGERSDLIARLQQHMADNEDLYSQAKFAHWNVKGENFWSLHRLFDEVADMVHPFTDTLAERISLLGGVARGTVRQTAAATSLEEMPDGKFDGHTLLRELQARFAEHADNSRKHAEASAEADPTTEDLFIEISRAVDQALYFIEAHLQRD